MSTPYHKIQSIFYRDPENNYKTFIDGKFSVDAFELCKDLEWTFTEKIDGTNIRIGWDDVADQVELGGRTDNAQLPGQLAILLAQKFTPEHCRNNLTGPVTLVGEGYGGKIQKGSGYREDQSFILFDVFIEPYPDAPMGIWLDREAVESIAMSLDIKVVPIIHKGPLLEGLELCRNGMKSRIANSPIGAEGVVARPSTELRDRMGRRLITKIKVKDFG